MSKVGSSDSKNTLYCSFCGKSQHEVRKLIAGPTVFICDECVELCMDIIREENKSSLVKSRDGIPTPKEIRKVLDDIRNEEGYAFILDAGSDAGVIVAADRNLDITEKVISRLKPVTAAAPGAVKPDSAKTPVGPRSTPAGVTRPKP